MIGTPCPPDENISGAPGADLRGHAEQIGRIREIVAIDGKDDIASSQPGLRGWSTGLDRPDQRAVRRQEPERPCQRLADFVRCDAEPSSRDPPSPQQQMLIGAARRRAAPDAEA